MKNEIAIPPQRKTTESDRIEYEIQWHLEKALATAEAERNLPISSNIALAIRALSDVARHLKKKGI